VGLGDGDDVFDELADVVVAFDGDGDDAAGAGGDLLDVGEGLFVFEDGAGVVGVLGGDADHGERLVDEGVGAVLHLAGGVAFGVDVGDLLELEGAFEGDGVVDAAAQEEEVAGGGELLGEVAAEVVHRAEDGFNLAGDLGQLGDEVQRGLKRDGLADLREIEREGEERGELRGEGLGAGDADLRAGVGGDDSLGEAGDGRGRCRWRGSSSLWR